MKFTKPLLLSGLLAAVVVGGLVLYGMSRNSAPTPVPPAQPAPPSQPQPAPEPAPPAPEPPVSQTKTYTNAMLGFTVEYSDPVIPTEDKQDMAMSGYIPVCDPDTAVVCFPYGKDQLPGTNFEGSAFSVHLLTALGTEAKCDAAGNGEQADGSATVGGISFRKFAFGDAAMGHQLSGENYRYFRNGDCFQLSTDVFTSTYENFPAGTITRFTDEDRAAVQHLLDAMLTSFRFNGK